MSFTVQAFNEVAERIQDIVEALLYLALTIFAASKLIAKITLHKSPGVKAQEKNIPFSVVANMAYTDFYLQTLASKLIITGLIPSFEIISRYRSPEYNAGIKGANPHSKHMQGLACDFMAKDPIATVKYIKMILPSLGYVDQVIAYPNRSFVHIQWYPKDVPKAFACKFLVNSGTDIEPSEKYFSLQE